ncbi:hypothetical protein [Verminephrobacter eiseniae]|uniref:hypothetical protein n=1 Tax=Verminephrobacter eiseniae TaxID=364317 RepID=UPI002238A928|nr:hypothetical protein [Verminephrobacter eiseniae]MCW5231636.1 hypothetical protein [Verminephrobacter eiseniae]MCW5293367.1 hypothetical protein [Verminephrobacter eiseniae]MCW8186316.1 hypothetical protein [Verminephrobacter eiseniae]MCW8224773.1 hypothetical protein [Verminephrobacter eiseniae]MCW8236618.1 hypothetical protein [Verminephrobacter eiseniae]
MTLFDFNYGLCFLVTSTLTNQSLAKKLPVIGAGQRMMLLKRVAFPDLVFPRWQSVLAISFIGVLFGLAPRLHAVPTDAPAWLGVVVGLVTGLVTTWAAFLVIVAVLRWWFKRGGRWDGQGDLFNLVAASWLMLDSFCANLMMLNAPPFLVLPFWLYSLWVGTKAMTSAIPQASRGYCIAGIAIGLLPAIAAAGLVFALVRAVMTGLVPGGAGA